MHVLLVGNSCQGNSLDSVHMLTEYTSYNRVGTVTLCGVFTAVLESGF